MTLGLGGLGESFEGDGPPATAAELSSPNAISTGAAGLLIADSGNNRVRFLPVASGTYYGMAMTAGDLYTIVGDGTAGYAGDGGPASAAELQSPDSALFDAAGDLVIADTDNAVVRFVPAVSGTYYGKAMTAGDLYTIAGDGTGGVSGDGGPATAAELLGPSGLALDGSGDLYVADGPAGRVRFVAATSGTYYGKDMAAGDIYTIAGGGPNGNVGDGGPATSANLYWPGRVALGPGGDLYIADDLNMRIQVVLPELPSATTTATYDTDGEETSATSPDGNAPGANAANYTTATTYDEDGEVTSSTEAGGAGATVTARTTSYTYDADGNLLTSTDARGKVTSYAYDADDEQVLVTDPDGNATLTCYDTNGDVAETVPPIGVAAGSLTAASCPTSYPADYGQRLAGDATTYAYDALGEETSVTSPAPAGQSGFETTTYAYDPAGLLITVTAPPTSDASGAPSEVTTYTYDPAGRLTSTTLASGTSAASVTSDCYDPDGERTATVPGDGNTSGVASCGTTSPWQTTSPDETAYAYDSLGELASATRPATTAAPSGQVTAYAYDPAGNLTATTEPNGVTETDTYNPLDELTGVTYSGSAAHEVAYTYDATGERLSMADGSGTSTYAYDPFGELTSVTNGAGRTTSYAYDHDGNVTGITYPLGSAATWATSGTVAYTYDAASLLTSVSDFEGNTIAITNSADGLPSSVSLGATGDTIATTYDPSDQPASIELDQGSSSLLGFSYADAPSGAILTETDTPASATSPAAYTYDPQTRVTSMTPGSSSTLSYAFDASGNLTSLPSGAAATYDDASELTSSVLSGATTTYTYDAAGERTGASSGGTTIASATWNGAGELASYKDAAATMSSATYDGDGLRTEATVTPSGGSQATQGFTWDETTAVPRLLMDGTNAYIYGSSTTPLEQVNLTTGTVSYLVADALGSVRGVVSSSGSLTASTSYDAWGNPETSGGLSADTPFGFAGGYGDPTGFVYLVNRYYDPTTGQFLSVDPLVDETGEPYAYTGDDPVNGVDPFGMITCPSWLPGCGTVTDIQNGVSAGAQAVGSFVYKYSGDIATVSSIAAATTIEVPGVGEVFGAVAIASGALSTERDIAVEHNLAAAVIDAAGTIASVGSLGAEGLATLLKQAAHNATTLGPVADFLAQDARSKEALSRFLNIYGAAISAGSFSVNQLLHAISKFSHGKICP